VNSRRPRRVAARRRRRILALGGLALIGALASALWLDHSSGARHSPATSPAAKRLNAAKRPVTRVAHRSARPSPASRALGLPPVPAGPIPGYLLIADRNNDRLLIVSPSKRIVWRFPQPGDLRRGQSFHDPDDAFFTPGYRGISTNEEFNQQIAEISLRSRRIIWSYGRAGIAGSGPDELSNPDDAYKLRNGEVMVADIRNCRVLRLSPKGAIVGEIGSAGRCLHDPPRSLLAPNGATPLPDGGVLVTEIGGYLDRIDARGRLLWSIRSPTSYPSDAQLLQNGDVLVAGFNTPGRIDELTPGGKIVWTYGPSSGEGALDRPSLAVRWPNGLIAATDDWHHRVVVIDPRTKRIVWQYGRLGIASRADGYLSKPDGLDLLPASAIAPADGTARPRLASRPLSVRRIGSLPTAASRMATAALPGGRILALGGLVGGSSSDQVLLGPPAHLRVVAHLPAPTHDAAAAPFDGTIGLFGGGQAVSTETVVRIDPTTGAARAAGRLDEPLSDLGATRIGGRTYLVGGYTGSRYATAVLRLGAGTATTTVARLPVGLRYAGIAGLDGKIYVAGGLTPSGESRAVYAIDPAAGTVRLIGRLPAPVAHAPLVVLRGALYLIGGRSASGAPLARILRIDPSSGVASRAGILPGPLADESAVVVGGRVIVLGGNRRASSAAVLEFRP
jgi:hypothetical protein